MSNESGIFFSFLAIINFVLVIGLIGSKTCTAFSISILTSLLCASISSSLNFSLLITLSKFKTPCWDIKFLTYGFNSPIEVNQAADAPKPQPQVVILLKFNSTLFFNCSKKL